MCPQDVSQAEKVCFAHPEAVQIQILTLYSPAGLIIAGRMSSLLAWWAASAQIRAWESRNSYNPLKVFCWTSPEYTSLSLSCVKYLLVFCSSIFHPVLSVREKKIICSWFIFFWEALHMSPCKRKHSVPSHEIPCTANMLLLLGYVRYILFKKSKMNSLLWSPPLRLSEGLVCCY